MTVMRVALLPVLLLAACGFVVSEQVEEPAVSGPPIAVVEPSYLVLRPVFGTRTAETDSEAAIYGQTVYFADTTLMDLRHFDLRTAQRAVPFEVPGEATPDSPPAIALGTTKEGNEILFGWTKQNVGKQIGIFLDGKLIAAPTIDSPIESTIVIQGDFTVEQADAVVARLRRGGAAVDGRCLMVPQSTIDHPLSPIPYHLITGQPEPDRKPAQLRLSSPVRS